MCGIFGIVTGRTARLTPEPFRSSIRDLFRYTESRGKEAAGFAIRSADRIFVHKEPMSARRLIRSRRYREILQGVFASTGASSACAPLAVIGHSRLATNGFDSINSNNQPVVKQGVVGVHNGIVVNVEQLWQAFPELARQYDVDTEIILALFRSFYEQTGSLVEAARATFDRIEGSASIGLLLDNLNHLVLATNTGSLYTCGAPGGDALLFASERIMLERLVRQRRWRTVLGRSPIVQLQPGHGLIVDLDDLAAQPFELGRKAAAKTVHVARPSCEAKIIDSMEQAEQARASLVRCTRCVLPETMPFIDFDDQGVCRYCRNHQPIRYQGPAALREAVAPYRSRDGEPDCVVAFSGGRDSSYSLHYFATELGMRPLAYTYDWGMVNGLARRNQARITGKLGIEHIIISADVRKKRRNIKKNIEAWLKSPDLGTVPLFMAGDKQFFYFANRLRRQTGIKLSVWAFNRLERTHFKTGFCGIQGGNIKGSIWQLRFRDRARLAAYYARQFLKNPAYLNSSLFDSAFAYFSYYLLDHDYFWFHDYIPWDEQRLNQTLHDEYDWETAADTGTTWRIGDGTAAFYNYIYYTVAGFTENDTFRSNQIREGLLSRDEALKKVEQDNVPRYESIREYTQIVGIDFGEALRVINAMPKRFSHVQDGHSAAAGQPAEDPQHRWAA